MAKDKDEAEKLPTKFFKLNEGRDIFWDPAQSVPDNRKLIKGQVKELEMTEAVASAKRGEHIIAAEAEDIAKAKKEAAKKEDEKSEKKDEGKKDEGKK